MNEKAETKVILKELIAIKKMLMLVASKCGATQPEIGKVLGVSARQVRNILGKRKRGTRHGQQTVRSN